MFSPFGPLLRELGTKVVDGHWLTSGGAKEGETPREVREDERRAEVVCSG